MFIIAFITSFASFIEIANPNPSILVMSLKPILTLFIPITSPISLQRAPPLLPGLIVASV